MSKVSGSPNEEPHLYGIRALACLAVIFHHFCVYFHTSYNFVHVGRGAVGIFFVLSGYLLGGKLRVESERTGEVRLANFIWQRILRIVPVAYVGLALIWTLNRCFGLYTQANYLPVVAFDFNLFSARVPLNLVHFWSLCIEMHCYIFLALVAFVIRKSGYKAAIIGAITAGLVVLALLEFQPISTAAWAWSFFLGALLAHRRLPRWFFFVTFLVLVGFFLKPWPGKIPLNLAHFTAGWLGSVLVVFGTRQPLAWLSSRPLVILGKMSFSLYVYQQIAFFSNFQGVRFPIALIMCVFLTYLSYRFVETPMNRLRHKNWGDYFQIGRLLNRARSG